MMWYAGCGRKLKCQKNRKDGIYMENTKIHNLVLDSSLKAMRIKEHPLEVSGRNLVVYDNLESDGNIKVYENFGGSLYLDLEPFSVNNIALIAGIEIVDIGEKKICVKKIFYEYGHEELFNSLVDAISHFADFYGFTFGFLDLRKK